VAPLTYMMSSLNNSVPIVCVRRRQEMSRTVVVIRPTGADVRPTVRAVTETA